MFNFKFSSIQAEVVNNIKSLFTKANPYNHFERLAVKLYGGKLVAAVLSRMDRLVIDLEMTEEQVATAKRFVKDLESIVDLSKDDKVTVKADMVSFKIDNQEAISWIVKTLPKWVLSLKLEKLENIVDTLNASVKTEEVD